MILKEKLKPHFMRLVDRALASTDIPFLPDWWADPVLRSLADACYDKYIDELLNLISALVEEEID